MDRGDFGKGFLTVGKENIRFWKAKRTFDQDCVMQTHNVFLGEHARGNVFSDAIFLEEKCLVVSSLGCLYILDVGKREVQGVYQIHETACISIDF